MLCCVAECGAECADGVHEEAIARERQGSGSSQVSGVKGRGHLVMTASVYDRLCGPVSVWLLFSSV